MACRIAYCASRGKHANACLLFLQYTHECTWKVHKVMCAWGKNWRALLMFSAPRVTDHTDFSFSRVERNEVTDYASVHPPHCPKISRSTQKDCQVPFILTYSLSNKLSVMWQGLHVSNLTTPPAASPTWKVAHPWGGRRGPAESRSDNVTDLPCHG